MSGAIPSCPHMPSWHAKRQLYLYPYFTVGKTRCNRIRNILFTDLQILNLLPELEEKMTISAGQKTNRTRILSASELKFKRQRATG
jgi:hypothetical protein